MMCARRYIVVLLCFTAALHASAQIQNQGWWKNAVFYQIYPRSLMDGKGNDGIGDLKGITSKLEHFVDIGVKGIWLSPIYKSPMLDLGYDISDFRDIQDEYGTLEDLEELIQSAKLLGLKVILDLVPNHTSDKHEWFQKSLKADGKYTDYYIWVDGEETKPPNNWLSVFGNSAWTWNDQRKQWYFHQFLPEQPDLNYRNPEVENEMQEVIEYWLKKGIDGFRIDAVPHLFETSNITLNEEKIDGANVKDTDYASLNHTYTKDQNETYVLVQKWRNFVDNYARINREDEKVLMTEAYTTLENTLKFYESGSHIPFNFKFITDVNSTSSASNFKAIIDGWIEGMPEDGTPNWVMGNHDRKRLATRYSGRADQMTMLAMILPGVAVTYYGEEIGMEDNYAITFEETTDEQACKAGKDKYNEVSRDPCRTPFQWNANESAHAGFSNAEKSWLPIHKNYVTLNLEQQKKDSKSHYHVYTSLTKLRNSTDALKKGSYESYVQKDDNVLIVKRDNNDESVALVINFSDSEVQQIDLKGITKRELAITEIKVASVGSGDNVKLNGHVLTVPAKASIVTYTTYKPENNSASKEHCNSFLAMILLSITVMALRS